MNSALLLRLLLLPITFLAVAVAGEECNVSIRWLNLGEEESPIVAVESQLSVVARISEHCPFNKYHIHIRQGFDKTKRDFMIAGLQSADGLPGQEIVMTLAVLDHLVDEPRQKKANETVKFLDRISNGNDGDNDDDEDDAAAVAPIESFIFAVALPFGQPASARFLSEPLYFALSWSSWIPLCKISLASLEKSEYDCRANLKERKAAGKRTSDTDEVSEEELATNCDFLTKKRALGEISCSIMTMIEGDIHDWQEKGNINSNNNNNPFRQSHAEKLQTALSSLESIVLNMDEYGEAVGVALLGPDWESIPSLGGVAQRIMEFAFARNMTQVATRAAVFRVWFRSHTGHPMSERERKELMYGGSWGLDSHAVATRTQIISRLTQLYNKYGAELREMWPQAAKYCEKAACQSENIEIELAYMRVREASPKLMLEVSPYFGYTTFWILNAMKANGHGTLFSFDIHNTSLTFLPDDLRQGRHRFFLGDFKETLFQSGVKLTDFDYLFIDSDHSAPFAEWYVTNLLEPVKEGLEGRVISARRRQQEEEEQKDNADYPFKKDVMTAAKSSSSRQCIPVSIHDVHTYYEKLLSIIPRTPWYLPSEEADVVLQWLVSASQDDILQQSSMFFVSFISDFHLYDSLRQIRKGFGLPPPIRHAPMDATLFFTLCEPHHRSE